MIYQRWIVAIVTIYLNISLNLTYLLLCSLPFVNHLTDKLCPWLCENVLLRKDGRYEMDYCDSYYILKLQFLFNYTCFRSVVSCLIVSLIMWGWFAIIMVDRRWIVYDSHCDTIDSSFLQNSLTNLKLQSKHPTWIPPKEKTAANCFSRMLSQRELIKYIK